MSLWSLPLEATQNEDELYSLGYAAQPPEGSPITDAVPVDFTGCNCIFTVKQTSSVNSVQIIRLVLGSGVAFGSANYDGVNVSTILVTLTDMQTILFPVGTWYFDILVQFPSGINTYYASGPFVVSPSVSR